MIKSYTDISQSKKLAEILPLESADMDYIPVTNIDGEYSITVNVWGNDHIIEEGWIPAWSLAALFKLLPKSAQLEKGNVTELYRVTLPVELEASDWYIDPIDACYEMIIRLNELNLL